MGEYIVEGLESLGTVWYIEVFNVISFEQRILLKEDIELYIKSFDDSYSRFKKTSRLSFLNDERRVAYDKHFARMLEIGLDAYTKSKGVFSLFIEQELVEKGYGDVGQRLEGHQVKGQAYPHIESETVFEIHGQEITLHGSGRVDLGGIGKGYLIDRIKERLQEKWNIDQFIINGGGDIYVTHNNDSPVEVYLKHPIQPDEVVGKVLLKNKAFCSSSSYLRTWEKDGVKRNHFVTPEGGDVWAASYVVGSTATDADIAATVLCITSSDEIKSRNIAEAFSVNYLVYDIDFHSHGNLVYTDLTQDA